MRYVRFYIGVLVVLTMCSAFADSNDGMLPLDGRWEYPHYLTFRPGNGQVCGMNPPRFSWPYVPHVVSGSEDVPLQEFCFQLSRTGDFSRPDIEVRTPYNFYNALPVLEKAKWHWRVGYGAGTKLEQWSPVRDFIFAPDAVEWDRTGIKEAAQRLAAQPHPRIGPPGGDWRAWHATLTSSERKAWLAELLRKADEAVKQPWWSDFPKTDRRGESKYDEAGFAEIGRLIAVTTFAHRLTGAERYAAAKDHALALARFPRGGVASPEFHGAKRKWPTQITEFLALCFDWWYDELTADERKVLLDSIEWRLRATFCEKYSWRSGQNIATNGVAVFCSSHPYENFMWSLPAVLVTAGDLPTSDELVELCLHYLTGVTNAFGPDEAWNEGPCYSSFKGNAMLRAAVYTALLVPEVNVERNPYLRSLGEWYAYMMPCGISCLPFGDYGADLTASWNAQRNNSRFLAWLTGDGRFTDRWQALASELGESPTNRPWLELLGSSRFKTPPPQAEKRTCVAFREAGWVMVGSQPPSHRRAYDDAVGMIFQCRPRGGYSHSYRAENDFVWYAYGQTLSAGGGGMAYPDPHSRDSLSHNVVLINGSGQEWNPRAPAYPFVGRLIACKEGDGYIHWVGDATHAYQNIPDLLRWYRHVVYVDNRWFAVFDDLAMRPDADPARFSWLFHVAPKVALTIAEDTASFSYRMADVHARVAFAGDPRRIEIIDMPGRKGFENLMTGEDIYDETLERLQAVGRTLVEEQWMAHNVWVTNRQPAREWTFLAALVAWRDRHKEPGVIFQGDRAVSVSLADGKSRTVSFDPGIPADIVIDVDAIRAHALATDPGVLPPTGRVETVAIDGDTYRVEWLAHETFEKDDWLSRWIVEGNSEVKAKDGRLCVRNLTPEIPGTGTIWFRPELPNHVVVRFRARAVPPAENNAANLNLFLHARESDGSPVRFGRSGSYKEYHQIPNYIVTLVGGCKPGWSRARRDPGFQLLHEADVRSEVGKEYSIVVALQDGRLRYYLDGRRIHDVQDPNPLPAGRFAIRTWSTNAWWDDVEFGRIIEGSK